MNTRIVILIIFVLVVMLMVILIPAIEEREYAKTHPDFLKNAYDLRNARLDQDTNIKQTNNETIQPKITRTVH